MTARLFAEMTSARRKSSIRHSQLQPAGGGGGGGGGGAGEGGRGPMAAGTWWSEVGEGIGSGEARVPRITCDREHWEKGEGGEALAGRGGGEGTRAGVDEKVGNIKVKNVNSRFIADDFMY